MLKVGGSAGSGIAQIGPTTEVLASFAGDCAFESISPDVVHEAKRSAISFMSTAIAGAGHPTTERMLDVVRTFAAPPSATLVGRVEAVDLPGAILLNAVSANVLDFDDTHGATYAHLGAPIWSASLGISEHRRLSGKEMILGFLVGAELACRVGRMLTLKHYHKGWHATTTVGVLGAAVASAKLLGLDKQRIVWTIGNAANRAAGLCQNLGSNAKSVGVGGAAQDGFYAALFAEAGVDASGSALEGVRGLVNVMSPSPHMDDALRGLGTKWDFLQNTYKPYPTCALVTAVVDATLAICAKDGFSANDLREIVVEGSPALLQTADRPMPASGRDSVLSLQHAVAVTIKRGRPGLAEFTDDAARDPAIASLRSKVRARSDAARAAGSVLMSAESVSGQHFVAEVFHPSGSSERPLIDDELSRKGIRLIREHWPEADAERLIETMWMLDTVSDIRQLLARFRKKSPMVKEGSRP